MENKYNGLLSKKQRTSDFKCVPTYRYKEKSKIWETVLEDEFTPIPKEKLDFISFITYNVWFTHHNWINRLKELHNIFEKYNPDFICLQEVTQEFLSFISSSKFTQENYYISGNFEGGYDVLMLSKYPTVFYKKLFPSTYGRSLLLAEFLIEINKNDIKNIIISTAHFESMSNTETRIQQLKISFDLLEASKTSFLMGDFNFDSTWKEESFIHSSYTDSWSEFKKLNNLKDAGYTMLASENFPAWRPDRILFKSEDKDIQLEYFEIIGNYKIEQGGEIMDEIETPSDHFGLFGKYKIIF